MKSVMDFIKINEDFDFLSEEEWLILLNHTRPLKRNDIIIQKADKGGNIIIMSKVNYNKICENLLENITLLNSMEILNQYGKL